MDIDEDGFFEDEIVFNDDTLVSLNEMEQKNSGQFQALLAENQERLVHDDPIVYEASETRKRYSELHCQTSRKRPRIHSPMGIESEEDLPEIRVNEDGGYSIWDNTANGTCQDPHHQLNVKPNSHFVSQR